MVSISAEQVFSSTFQISNAEQVQATNNKVTSSLAKVGRSWNMLKGNLEQGQATLALVGGREGVAAGVGFLIGSESFSESPETFLGQVGQLAGSIGVFTSVANSAQKAVAESQERYTRLIKIREWQLGKLDEKLADTIQRTNNSIFNTQTLALRGRRTRLVLSKAIASFGAVTAAIGPMIVAAIAAAIGGQLIGNALDKISKSSLENIENTVTPALDRVKEIATGFLLGLEFLNEAAFKIVDFSGYFKEYTDDMVTIFQPRATETREIRKNLARQQEFLFEKEEELQDMFLSNVQRDREIETIKQKFNELTREYSYSMARIAEIDIRRGRK